MTGHSVTAGGLGKENHIFGYWHTHGREFAMPFTFRLIKPQTICIIFHVFERTCLRQVLHSSGNKNVHIL